MPSFRLSLRSLSYGAAAALVLIAALVAPAQASPSVAPGTASEAVDRFSTAVIAAVKGDGAARSAEERYRRLSGLVGKSFNLPAMMESAAGSRWRSASIEQRDLLTDAFLRMSIGTYLTRFEDYTGEYFVVTGEQLNIDGTTRVATRLVRPHRPDLSVTYVTQKFEDDWRIVDLIFGGGVSELAVRKSEFAGALARGGMPNLIARLNEQAAKMLAHLGIADPQPAMPTDVIAVDAPIPR